MVYISQGNRRMKIPTFSLPAEKTCPSATTLCKKHCYAKKAERVYPNVLPSRERNLMDSKKDSFVYKMSDIIKKRTSPYIRIHESGDFYNQIYLDKWFRICRLNPDKMFMVYTQRYDLNFSHKPNNLIVYWTIWPDSKEIPKDGLKAYVVDDKKLPKYKKQPKGFKCSKGKGNNITCDKCLYCYKGKGDVIFKLH